MSQHGVKLEEGSAKYRILWRAAQGSGRNVGIVVGRLGGITEGD